MRTRGFGFGLIVVAGMLLGPSVNPVKAQTGTGWDVSGYPSLNTPLPLGPSRADTGGIYGALEFVFMHGTRAIGSQLLAIRGFTDSDGSLTNQQPGVFVGSRRFALDTDSFGRTTWTPGYRLTIGYKLENGWAIALSYMNLSQATYSTSATPVPPGQIVGSDFSDSFLYSPVFNYSPEFSGPPNKAQGGSGFSPSGIWNGATQMDLKFVQRFTNMDFTVRVPVVESEYARSYGLAGARFSWIWERLSWLTISRSADGSGGGPQDAALYTNIISQRMYGPFLGVGNEVYLGEAFALSGDITCAALYSVVKQRAKYELYDDSTQSKRSRIEYTIVPNINASLNLWWYPIEGVQMRIGYNIMSYFNTIYMDQPVGFNVGAIDPVYSRKVIRIYHGIDVGIGFSF